MQRGGRRWAFDLQREEGRRGEGSSSSSSSGGGGSGVVAPVGFRSSAAAAASRRENRENTRDILKRKAWEFGYSPVRNIFMTMLMAWLTGSGVNIFNISITLYTLFGPIKALTSIRQDFARFAELGGDLIVPVMLYILLHLANFGIGAYKAYHLGILPTDADWGMHLDVKEPVEFSGGGVPF